VREAIAAINERDVERYLALCAPDIELVSPVAAIEGASKNAGGIREFFAGVYEAANEFRLDVESLQELGDGRVLAFISLTFVSKGGAGLTEPIANIYTLSERKLRKVDVYRDRERALDAAGMR
jgi:ketosteroid isomerase-like protein